MMEALVASNDIAHVTDDELVVRLRGLVRSDRALNLQLIVHIGEVDARGLYREYAYASMYTYCVGELRMSEAQALLRIRRGCFRPTTES